MEQNLSSGFQNLYKVQLAATSRRWPFLLISKSSDRLDMWNNVKRVRKKNTHLKWPQVGE